MAAATRTQPFSMLTAGARAHTHTHTHTHTHRHTHTNTYTYAHMYTCKTVSRQFLHFRRRKRSTAQLSPLTSRHSIPARIKSSIVISFRLPKRFHRLQGTTRQGRVFSTVPLSSFLSSSPFHRLDFTSLQGNARKKTKSPPDVSGKFDDSTGEFAGDTVSFSTRLGYWYIQARFLLLFY